MAELVSSKEQNYIDQIEYLNQAYSALASENAEIKKSRAYRFALLLKTIFARLHLIGTVRLILDIRRFGLRDAWQIFKNRKNGQSTNSDAPPAHDVNANHPAIKKLLIKKEFYLSATQRMWDPVTKKLAGLIEDRVPKGIIVCPASKNKVISPVVKKLIYAIAEQNFLCFLCQEDSECGNFTELRKNVFEINGEEYLISVLQNKNPVVFVSDLEQSAFVAALPQCVIWYNFPNNSTRCLEKWEEKLHENMLKKAALVTYTGEAKAFSELTKSNVLCLDKILDAAGDIHNNQADRIIRMLLSTHEGLKALADFSYNSDVALETVTFFKYDGTTYYSGGAERYLLDLHEACAELGVSYRIYQYAEYNWVRYYNDVEVVGLAAKENNVNAYGDGLVSEMDMAFIREATNASKLNIYSPFYIISGKGFAPTVGISHGISWDNEQNHFQEGNAFWNANKGVIDAASYCDQMISVDTNTCNWFQTLDYKTGRKIHYIPNYVDTQEFSPRENYLALNEKVVITYPRRLYGPRGLYVVLDVIDEILGKYPNVEFHFVGKGFEEDTKYVDEKIAQWGERIKWYSKAPNQMNEVYKMTDISLIPTMYSEGTSLSCLEALASGNVVIATRIGGLTDLVLNDYNGKLVEPNGGAIKDAIFDLLDHPEKMQQLKINAVDTARAFSKDKWKKEWKKIISEYVPVADKYSPPKRCMVKLKSSEDLMKTETTDLIRTQLENGWCVFVACENNPMRLKSYKRLQYIDLNEDLYFVPEKIIDI